MSIIQLFFFCFPYLFIIETTALKTSEYSPITKPSKASIAVVWASAFLSAGPVRDVLRVSVAVLDEEKMLQANSSTEIPSNEAARWAPAGLVN